MKFDSILEQQIAYGCGVEVDIDLMFETVYIYEIVENGSMKKELYLDGHQAKEFIEKVDLLVEKYCDENEGHEMVVAYLYLDLLDECEPVNI